MSFSRKIKKELAHYLVDITASAVEANPVFTAFEVGVVGMSDKVSMNARLTATAISFAGIGYVYSRGRDVSRGFFRISDESKEWLIKGYDILYSAAFSLACTPIIYYVAGAKDLKEIVIGAGVATIVGGLNGGFAGYSIDVFRDLTGLKECNRKSYPQFLKKRSPFFKRLIAGGLVTASIGTLGAIYALTPDRENGSLNQTEIRQADSNTNSNGLESIVKKY